MSNATHNDGGSAFPHEADYIRNNSGGYDFKVDHHPGMTLRDYFAGQALAAIPLKDAMQRISNKSSAGEVICAADLAYRYADQMLKAREENK